VAIVVACPNGCSGHGRCMNMREMAIMLNAFPLSAAASYKSAEDSLTWDQDRIYGCVCDSLWTVGLAAGQRQQSQWFGYDCSQRTWRRSLVVGTGLTFALTILCSPMSQWG
jgi:hypothetical protein